VRKFAFAGFGAIGLHRPEGVTHDRRRSEIGTANAIATPTVRLPAAAYGTRAFFTGAFMNAKLLVPLIATAALLAACGNRNNDTGVGGNSDSGAGTTNTPDDTATTPGGTAGESGSTPATPPDTAAPPPADTPDNSQPSNPPPSGGQ
jgi:hypothetical protein